MADFVVKNDKYEIYRDSHTRELYLKDLSGKVILGPYSSRHNIFFCGDAVILETRLRYDGDPLYDVYSIVDGEKKGYSVYCNKIRALDNGNLVLYLAKSPGKVVIYDTKNGKVCSNYYDFIGSFDYDEKSGIYFASAKLEIPLGDEFGSISFYGKINADGKLISPLFNSFTEEMILIKDDNDALYDEINKTKNIMKQKKLEKKEKINNLPFVEPYKLY